VRLFAYDYSKPAGRRRREPSSLQIPAMIQFTPPRESTGFSTLAKGCCKTPFLGVGAPSRLQASGCTPPPWPWATELVGSPGIDPGPRHLARWSSALQPQGTDTALWPPQRLESAQFRRCVSLAGGRSFLGRRGSGRRGGRRFCAPTHGPAPRGQAQVAAQPPTGPRGTQTQKQAHSQPRQGPP